MYAKDIAAQITQLKGKNILIFSLLLFIILIMSNIFKICGFNGYLKTRRIKKDGFEPSLKKVISLK